MAEYLGFFFHLMPFKGAHTHLKKQALNLPILVAHPDYLRGGFTWHLWLRSWEPLGYREKGTITETTLFLF